MISKTTHYRRLKKARELQCSVDELSDNRGKHGNHRRGSKSHLWNNGKLLTRDGYVLIRVGVTHPFADPNGYCKEHVLIWYSAGNRYIPGEVIHHLNGDRTDNRLENLKAMPIELHNRIHNQEKSRDSKGRFVGKKKAGHLLDGKEYHELPTY